MHTTIKISKKLKDILNSMKLYDNETYEEVIEDLLEDRMELNEEFKKEVMKALEEVRKGKTVSFSKIKKRYGL